MTTFTEQAKLPMLVATFFGSGLSPIAPGTVGSLAALLLAYVLLSVSVGQAMLVIGVLFFVGVWASNAVEAALEQHDASLIVIDEVVGQCLVVALLDVFLRGAVDTTLLLLLSFIGFRLFDVVKPWPVGWVDNKVEGGLGVMLDDVVAALLAVPFLAGGYLLFALTTI
jgi:phosphatidylglycerophosphatase A